MNKAQIVFHFVFMACNQAAEILQPSEQSFHQPSATESAQWTTVLSLGFTAIGFVRRNHFDAVFGHAIIQAITVIGTIINQSLGESIYG